MKSTLKLYGPLLIAAALVVAFYDLGQRYDHFRVHNGPPYQMELSPNELVLYAWYAVFGSLFVVAITVAALTWSLPARMQTGAIAAARSRWFLPVTTALVLVEILVVKDFVLHGTAVTDDEHVYDFIARTLLEGRVVNPTPPDRRYYSSIFVLMREGRWYGKYPIGHPLVLALGELTRLRFVIVPLVAATSYALTYRCTRKLLGAERAALAAVLLLVSPQFVMTAATELSQNTSMLAMLIGISCVLALRDAARPLLWLAAAGAAVGFGVLTRPMPGVLFAMVLAFGAYRELRGERANGLLTLRIEGGALRNAFVFGLPAVLIGGVILYVNFRQTGSVLQSGYTEVHGVAGALAPTTDGAAFTNSFMGGLLRQLFWVVGGPLILLFVPCVFLVQGDRERRALSLFGLLVVADYSYRIISPKVFVGTTGPVYLAEIVPCLAVLAAAGIFEARKLLARVDERAPHALVGALVGAVFASMAMFVPVQLAALERNAKVQRFIPDALATAGETRALVFTLTLTHPGSGDSWAFLPPAPDPTGKARIMYVRIAGDPADVVRFARQYYPDRRAYVLDQARDGQHLVPIERLVPVTSD